MRLDRLVDTRPLRSSPPFRRLWLGGVLSGLGGQLTVVAVLAQVWALTRDEAWVGAIGLAHAIPMVVFGLVGGTIADAVDRRKLVLLATIGQLLAATLLAAQAFGGLDSVGALLGLVALQAACGAVGAPARKAFIPRLLPTQLVGAGIAVTHLGFQVAMLIGPALGGLIAGRWGVGVCYLVDALTFGAAMYGVARLPAMRPEAAGTSGTDGDTDGSAEATERPGIRSLLAGWAFVVRRPVVAGALLTDVLATVLAMPIALFPVINAERYADNPELLGLFLSAIAVGGIVAGATSGTITRARRPGAVMLAAASGWGIGLAGFGLAEPLWLALGCLMFAGAADTISVISRGVLVQLATPDSHRGRVSAVEHVIGVAGPDLGNFRAGLVAGGTSAAFSAVSGGLACVLGVAAVALRIPALRRFVLEATPEPDEKTAAR